MKHLACLGIGLSILLFAFAPFCLTVFAIIKPMIGVPIFVILFAYLLGLAFTQ
jgi:hypothetical protein